LTRTALVLVALALTGCETTAERSAKLEREAARHASRAAASGLSIARESREVRVLAATVVRGSEGAAAVVTLRNTSSHTLRAVPLAITVSDGHGKTLYQNNAAGLETALVSVPSLAAHGELSWVDDQVPASGEPVAASARVGEAPAATGSVPLIVIGGAHLIEDPSNGVGASGIVSNRSRVPQDSLVIFAVARRAGRIVAAGRAVLPELAASSSMPFQIFFVGDPHGAQLQLSAPPTRLG
jgi:hypothetical protein